MYNYVNNQLVEFGSFQLFFPLSIPSFPWFSLPCSLSFFVFPSFPSSVPTVSPHSFSFLSLSNLSCSLSFSHRIISSVFSLLLSPHPPSYPYLPYCCCLPSNPPTTSCRTEVVRLFPGWFCGHAVTPLC